MKDSWWAQNPLQLTAQVTNNNSFLQIKPLAYEVRNNERLIPKTFKSREK